MMMTVTVDQQGSEGRLRFVTRILPVASPQVDYQFGLIFCTTKVVYWALSPDYALRECAQGNPGQVFSRHKSVVVAPHYSRET